MTEPGEREVADTNTEEVEPGTRRQAGQAPVSTSLLLCCQAQVHSQKSQYQLTMMYTK